MKITRFGALLLALTLPMSIAAQTAATPATDAPVNVDPARVYGNMIRTAERAIVGLAEAMPEEKYSFAPAAGVFAAGQSTEFKGVRTFAQQVAHVASSNYEYLQGMGLEKDKDFAAIEKLTTKAEALQALKDSFAAAEKAAAAITPQNAFEGTWTAEDQDSRGAGCGDCVAHHGSLRTTGDLRSDEWCCAASKPLIRTILPP